MRTLPNLNAVRAFDAAARHGSFARAADELGVSHAAVSRHVRTLETELGVALFERHARHVVLTGEGTMFALTASEALSRLELDTARLRRKGGRGTVVLDVESDLAARWLMPLLTEEIVNTLNVTLDIRVRPDPPRSVLGDVDLALCWGAASCTGFKATPFFALKAFPVGAPSLIDSGPSLDDPDLYLSHRLIHERGVYWWRTYFDKLGLDFGDADRHLFLNRSYLCIEAAARGLGIAIGDDGIAREHLSNGELIRLPGPVLPSRDQYFLLTPDVTSLSRPVRRVRDWLLEQAATLDIQGE
ncbi:MAG: LysR family transcriptional regulator [Pseudomonadota bacterium]